MTMQDIAEICGVAKSTVSRYFNGGYVKDETREKIKQAIEKNNYQPNAFAQSLKAKESHIIGIIAPCLDSNVSSRIMMSIDECLRFEGYTSLIINTDHKEQLELENIENLWRLKVDGIILIATHISDEHKKSIAHIDVPVVVVGQAFADGVSIVNDDFAAGWKIGHYAVEHGHRDIIYLGVDEIDEAVGKIRKQGVLEGCGQSAQVEVMTSDFSFQNAYELCKQIIHQRIPDMIICATDMMAMGVYKALREHQIQVPQQVSLMGFGGYEISGLITPTLTTVRFDNVQAGCVAAQTLLHMMKKEPVNSIQVIPFTFLEGESVRK